jgi:hypothetical protein
MSTIQSLLEQELIYHYHDTHLPVLMLPNAHDGFFKGYRSQMLAMILSCDMVKCAVLACSASNKYMLSNGIQYQTAATWYNSQAVKAVNQNLAELCSSQKGTGDSLLIAVTYLYLHAVGFSNENRVNQHADTTILVSYGA